MSDEQQKLSFSDIMQILDHATNPANAGKLTRVDYARCEMALQAIGGLFRDLAAQQKPKEE